MFSSIKRKIIFFITLIMAITAVAVLKFTHRDVGNAMLEAQKASAQNVLRLVELNIKVGFDKLLSDKIEMVFKIQRDLKTISDLCRSVLKEYTAMSESHMLSSEEAQKRALIWLKSLSFEKWQLFVFKRDASIIAHQDPAMEGRSISELQDMKGRNISKVMRDDVLREGGDSAVFIWKKAGQLSDRKKLGYFIPFRSWQWTVGAMIDFDAIEAESRKQKDKIIGVLKNNFGKIKIAKSGFVFLFNGQGEMLIPPPAGRILDHQTPINTYTGHGLFEDLMQAAESDGHRSMCYINFSDADNQAMEAHTRYFRALDWYITAAIPVQEISQPAKDLITRQSYIIAMIFMASLVIAFILMSKISHPLKLLAAYAKALPSLDFTAQEQTSRLIRDLTRKYKDEVGRLAESFVYMEAELKKNIKALVNTTATKERIRHKKEAAEAANRAKSDFLANMSHEIRTPLNAIINMCELAMNDRSKRKQNEYLKIMRSSSNSLLGIINDILDFSKIEAGKISFENIQVSLREIIEEVCDMFHERIQAKSIEFIVDIAPDTPRRVITDPLRLKQVLVNLTANALKFTQKGEICLSVQTRERLYDTAELLFCVKDSGIGIEPEVQKDLFSAFTQADGTITRKYGGTGLGLAICKKIVTLMKGDIWLESQPGSGSSFFFTAAFKTCDNCPETNGVIPTALANLKVLLVEDNPLTLSIIQRHLELFHFQVQSATTAEKALDCYRQALNGESEGKHFDLILIDRTLPDMDGIVFSEKIKRDLDGSPPPIIILAPNANADDINLTNACGIDRFLIKPIKQSLLFDAIMETFGYSERLSQLRHPVCAMDQAVWNIRLLLVEDNPVNQMVAIDILKSAGISVDTAGNGREAIAAVKANTYDAVLMDVQMPEMDGFKATQAIRKEQGKESLPIIAMTAHAMQGDREKCFAAGMNGYVPKPIDRRQLFRALAEVVPDLVPASAPRTEPPPVLPTAADIALPPSLPGLNIGEGIGRLEGNWQRYVQILNEFCSSQSGAGRKLRELLELKEFQRARQQTHSLKGAAGNVSAFEVMLAAENLEKSLSSKNEESMQKALSEVDRALAELLNSLAQINRVCEATPPQRSPSAESGSSDALCLIQRLDESLRTIDPVESECCFREIDACTALNAFKSQVKNLGQHINNYQFDEARRSLERLSQTFQDTFSTTGCDVDS